MRPLKAFLFSAILFLPLIANSQALKPGQWRTYTSLRTVTDLAVSNDSMHAWAATTGGAFEVDLDSAHAQPVVYHTTEGLTENDLTSVASDADGNVYFGGGLGGFDILDPQTGSVTQVTDIFSLAYPNKAINGITVYGNTVYLATGFGVSVYLRNEGSNGAFGETAVQLASLPAQDSIRQVVVDGSMVYAAAREGVVWAKLSSDLQASSSWHLLPDTLGAVRALVKFRGTIYAGARNGLFAVSTSPDSLIYTPLPNSLAIERMLVANDSLYLLDTFGVLYSTVDFSHLASQALTDEMGSKVASVAYSALDGIVAGSIANGTGYTARGAWVSNIFPPGPIVNATNYLTYSSATDAVYISQGGAGCNAFEPGSSTWFDYQSGVNGVPVTAQGFQQMLYDSIRNVVWIAAYGGALYNISSMLSAQPKWDTVVPVISGLPTVNGNSGTYSVTGGMMLDASGNFLVTNWAGNGEGLCYSSDGTNFKGYYLGTSLEPWGDVTQDMYGNYWVGTEYHALPKSTGVYWVRASDGTAGVIYGGSSGNLGPALEGTEYVNAILTDQDDGIWCGTEAGVEIIANPEEIIGNNSPQFSIRSVQFTTNQVVNSMAVDGVGNKWIATTNGIFVVSPDGSDSVAHFTAENSPLISDQVQAIAIDPTRGEAYAGSPAGISRFSTIFKQGRPDYSSIRVYPNPVVQTAEASPTVYIDGLVAGSTIQVFSLAGQLITTIDGTALGSTVPWNGRDALGRQVPSGMYLISATSPQSGGNGEAKVVIVRKPSN